MMMADTFLQSRRAWQLAIAAIVVAGLLARTSVLIRTGGRLDDPDNYLPLARSVAAGNGFALDGRPTAYRPPLYPLVLAPIVGLVGAHVAWGVAGLHLALGAGGIVLTAVAARRLGLSPARALLAAAVVALDPVLVAQAGVVMTENLAALLTAATLAALGLRGRFGAALSGAMFGLAALCRPSVWPVASLTTAVRILPGIDAAPASWRQRWSEAGLILAAALVTITPWAARNALVLGEPIATTTHGGYTLALANNPVYYDEVVNGPPGAVWTGHNQWLWWDSVNRANAGLAEPVADRRLRSEALRFIASRPVDFVRACAQRLGRFWGVAPAGAVYPRGLRIATAVWTIPLWIALLLGLVRNATWRWPLVTATLFLLGLSLVHTVFWTDMRMRSAVVPAIAIVAATGFPTGLTRRNSGVFERFRSGKNSKNPVRFCCSNHGETLG